MKTSAQITLSLLLITMFANAQDTWVQKADFGGSGRFYSTGFSMGNKAYIGTGYTQSYYHYGYANDFWEYDPATNVWAQKANFIGEGRCYAVSFSIGGKGYIGTGEYWNGAGNTYFKDFYEYDPITNIWTTKASFPGEVRSEAVCFVISNKAYVGVGRNDVSGNKKDFWEFDPALNSWRQIPDFGGAARFGAIGFSVNNKGYVGLGWDGSYAKDIWEYDPAVNQWKQKGNFPGTGFFDGVSFTIGSRSYVGTGYPAANDFWEYNPLNDSWTQQKNFPGAGRDGAVGFSIGDKGYIGTGESSIYLKDFWQYTPSSIPDTCSLPMALRVASVTKNAALIKWNIPADTPANYKIRYRAVGDTATVLRKTKGSNNRLLLTDLKANTTYKWQMRSICVFDTSAWINGPDFITKEATAMATQLSNTTGLQKIVITPNPGNGDFVLKLQLPTQSATTVAYIYTSDARQVWKQELGNINNTYIKRFNLSGILTHGVYVLQIKRNDLSMSATIIIKK